MRHSRLGAVALVCQAAVMGAIQTNRDPTPAAKFDKSAVVTSHVANVHGVKLARRELPALSRASVARLGADFHAIDVRMKAPQPVEIVSIETGDSRVVLTDGTKYQTDEVVTLPIKGREVTVEARTAAGTAFWTGIGMGEAQVPSTMTHSMSSTPGCEIFVETQPPGVTVLFNGKRWRNQTNTATVRDPGAWTVTLRRSGYQDWTGTRELGPRQTWRISAVYP